MAVATIVLVGSQQRVAQVVATSLLDIGSATQEGTSADRACWMKRIDSNCVCLRGTLLLWL